MEYRVTCRTCSESFDPRESRGKWECRIHVTPTRDFALRSPPSRGYGSVYRCCGIGAEEETWIRENEHLYVRADEVRGCVPADHMEETSPNPRRIDDLHLIPLLPTAPDLTSSPAHLVTFNVHYKDVHESVARTVHYDLASGGANKLDLRERLLRIVEMAYGNVEFQTAALMKKRDRKIPVILPRNDPIVYDRLWGTSGSRLSDTEFLKLYYMLVEPDVYKIRIAVLRAASPVVSDETLAHVRQQFEHWQRVHS